MNTQWQTIEVSKLRKAVWNYKNDDPRITNVLAANIKKNGVLLSLIVRPIGRNFEVLNGNHRLDVLTELGIKQVLCCNVGKVSDEDAQLLGIATNELSDNPDAATISKAMAALAGKFKPEDILATIPFKRSQLDAYIAAATVRLDDWTPPAKTKAAKHTAKFTINPVLEDLLGQAGVKAGCRDHAKAFHAAVAAIADKRGV